MQDSTTTSATDWDELLIAARDGDNSALSEIWTRLRAYLRLTADHDLDGILQNKMDASDIVQQSLMEAHQGFSRFRGQSEHEIRAWLVRLVRHNLIDARRRFVETDKRNVSRELSAHTRALPGPDKTPSSLVSRKEQDEELMRAVTLLPARNQQILELRHRQGLSHAEIAEELGMTEMAARQLWSRTVDQLRNQLVRRRGDSLP